MRSEAQGKIGETLVYSAIKAFENEGAKITGNCYIPLGNGKTTEVDVILISSSGIFVIESKNYNGWVFGNEGSINWMQTFGNGRRKQFYNPILQNKVHVDSIKRLISKDIPIYSVIVFSDSCELKSIEYTEKAGIVVKLNKLKQCIIDISSDKKDCLSADQIEEIWRKLHAFQFVSRSIYEKHIYNIQREDIEQIKYEDVDIDEVLINRCQTLIDDKEWTKAKLFYEHLLNMGLDVQVLATIEEQIIKHEKVIAEKNANNKKYVINRPGEGKDRKNVNVLVIATIILIIAIICGGLLCGTLITLGVVVNTASTANSSEEIKYNEEEKNKCEEEIDAIRQSQVGDVVIWGKDSSDIQMRWRVVEQQADKVLLMKETGLFEWNIANDALCNSYIDTNVRKQLVEFYNANYFSQYEKNRIISQELVGDNGEIDELFVLSKEEYEHLFVNNEDLYKKILGDEIPTFYCASRTFNPENNNMYIYNFYNEFTETDVTGSAYVFPFMWVDIK